MSVYSIGKDFYFVAAYDTGHTVKHLTDVF